MIRIAGALFLVWIATISSAGASTAPDSVRLGAFTVAWPPGNNWHVECDTTAGWVRFTTKRKWIADVVQATTIAVYPIFMSGNALSEDSSANGCFAAEARRLEEEGRDQKFTLKDVSYSKEAIADKRLHVMRWNERTNLSLLSGRGWLEAVQAALYLWFPPDFENSHRLFEFMIREDYQKENLRVSLDPTRIQSLIASFNFDPSRIHVGDEIVRLLQAKCVDPIDLRSLAGLQPTEIAGRLGNGFGFYPPPGRSKSPNDRSTAAIGIGAEIGQAADTLVVTAVSSAAPAEEVGLLPGDRIVGVEGRSAVGMTANEASAAMGGPPGSRARFIVSRHGLDHTIEFEFARDSTAMRTVLGCMTSDHTGYVRIVRFDPLSGEHFKAVLHELKAGGMERLVLDLRNNPGGRLGEAISVMNELLPQKTMIVRARGSGHEANADYMTDGQGGFRDLPLVVLVDGGTASGSEVIASAVQDLDRGIVVGEPTAGVSIIAQTFRLGDGSSFTLPFARWYAPSGRCLSATNGRNPFGDSYKSRRGRPVPGGHGIVPDSLVSGHSWSGLAVELMARDLFRSYAVMAVPNSLQSQQGAATSGDESLVAFHGYVAQAGLDIDGAEFERDKPEIESLLRAAIEERSNAGRTKCGIRLGADPQLAKALTVFREAKMVSGLH